MTYLSESCSPEEVKEQQQHPHLRRDKSQRCARQRLRLYQVYQNVAREILTRPPLSRRRLDSCRPGPPGSANQHKLGKLHYLCIVAILIAVAHGIRRDFEGS